MLDPLNQGVEQPIVAGQTCSKEKGAKTRCTPRYAVA